MSLFLCALIYAEEIPAGARVVVAKGAPLMDALGNQPVIPESVGAGWPAIVVKDEGDRLQIRLQTTSCAVQLSQAFQMAAVTFSVDERSLLPMLAKEWSGTSENGDAWLLAPGTPLIADPAGASVQGRDLYFPETPHETTTFLFSPAGDP